MNKNLFAAPASILLAGLFAACPASAQLNILHAVDFNNPAAPWAATGSVSITGTTLGAPVIQSVDIAPGSGNTHAGLFDGTQARYGTDFSGIDTATTGYGVQLWVKNPSSSMESFLWLNIASFGYPGDSGDEPSENGVGLGLFEGEYWGVSNRLLRAPAPGVSPGGIGSINGWDHLAFVADGNVGRYYVNGVLAGSRTYTDGGILAPGANWHLFSGQNGFPAYVGLADELKFFTFASGTFQAASLDYAIVTQIPEPSAAAALLGAGALILAANRRRARRTN